MGERRQEPVLLVWRRRQGSYLFVGGVVSAMASWTFTPPSARLEKACGHPGAVGSWPKSSRLHSLQGPIAGPGLGVRQSSVSVMALRRTWSTSSRAPAAPTWAGQAGHEE